MPGKELTVKVNLDTKQASSNIGNLEKRLQSLYKTFDKANQKEAGIDKQIIQYEKLKVQQEKLALAREKFQSQEAAQLLKLEQMEQNRLAKQEANVDKMLQKEMDAMRKKQEAQWKAFEKETAQYEKELQREQALLQKELEKERIRQQSLHTLTQTDKAGQRIANNMERVKRSEYEAWWQAELLKQEWQKSHPILSKLDTAWGKISSRIQQVLSKHPRLNNAFTKSTSLVTNIVNKVRSWAANQRQVTSTIKNTNSGLGAIWSKLKGIAATYLGIMGTRAVVDTTDLLVGAQNRLNYVAAGQLGDSAYNADGTYSAKTLAMTQEALDKMYVSSQKVRTSYQGMISNVSKTMTLAGDAFGNNIDNAIRFQEIMAEAYAVGGASAQEMSTSMYQLTQALGSGLLQGDELRSVREGAPLAYQAIEEFAQGVLNSEESLKELASQGKITSEMVVAAIMDMGSDVDKAFKQTRQTFGQTFDQIKNSALYAFQPVMELLTDALNKAVDNGMVQKFEQVFTNVAKAIMIVFRAIEVAINWIADNWSWLKHILISGLLLYTAYLITTTGIAITRAIIAIAGWLAEYGAILTVVAGILMLIYITYAWKNGTIDTCTAIVAALAVVGVALLILGIVFNLTWMIWVAAVLLAIAVFVMFFEQVCGIAMWLGAVLVDIILVVWNFLVLVINLVIGLIAWCGATIYNLFVACFNALMQAIWAIFVDPMAGIIEWFVNAFNGGFNGILGAAANAIGQLVSMFLSGLKVITKAIDAVAGTELSAKITSWQDSAKSWGKNENAVTYKVNAPELSRVSATNAYKTGASTLGFADLVNPMDAYNSGANWGAGVKDNFNTWASKFQNDPTKKAKEQGNLLDKLGGKLGLTDAFANMGQFPTEGAGSGYSPDLDKLAGGVGDIGDNTGKIADSMDLTQEDLEYLRRIADMEWKKEYTTANITVDMSNYNTINGDSDLDGIVTKLSDKLREEMNVLADGVYAY